jgi:hypothetical protein
MKQCYVWQERAIHTCQTQFNIAQNKLHVFGSVHEFGHGRYRSANCKSPCCGLLLDGRPTGLGIWWQIETHRKRLNLRTRPHHFHLLKYAPNTLDISTGILRTLRNTLTPIAHLVTCAHRSLFASILPAPSIRIEHGYRQVLRP